MENKVLDVVLDVIDIRRVWEYFDFNSFYPDQLNEIEAMPIELKNHAIEEDWENIAPATPKSLKGWLYCHAWFNNMIEGVPGRKGYSKLQYRHDMGKPIEVDGYANSNNGAIVYFIPKVYVGGEYRYKITFKKENNIAKLYVK